MPQLYQKKGNAMEYKDEFQEEGLIVKAPSMLQIYQKAELLSRNQASVLIYGESGVGKSYLANYIRQNGNFAKAPFVCINCNAIPSELFASELFGYTPNAFTGASSKGKIGLLATADHGTVLFDEINELSSQNQTLLLHFLQNKTITPLGSVQSREIDARIICTSGRDLREMIKAGTFRLDLYYRICVANIYIPPIRERREEIPYFIHHFLQHYASEYQCDIKHLDISERNMHDLSQLNWEGNIREIENLAQQICLMDDSDSAIDAYRYRLEHKAASPSSDALNNLSVKPLKDALREFEKNYIQNVIDNSENLVTAAMQLGISFSTLSRKKLN
jgi:transcriptional regulator with PAS, ATPase and Fis domain